jgi:hypothetical protein
MMPRRVRDPPTAHGEMDSSRPSNKYGKRIRIMFRILHDFFPILLLYSRLASVLGAIGIFSSSKQASTVPVLIVIKGK